MKCPVEGKTIFVAKRDARAFINARPDLAPLREYPCPHCEGWHITKKIKESSAIPRQVLNRPLTYWKDFKKYLE